MQRFKNKTLKKFLKKANFGVSNSKNTLGSVICVTLTSAVWAGRGTPRAPIRTEKRSGCESPCVTNLISFPGPTQSRRLPPLQSSSRAFEWLMTKHCWILNFVIIFIFCIFTFWVFVCVFILSVMVLLGEATPRRKKNKRCIQLGLRV